MLALWLRAFFLLFLATLLDFGAARSASADDALTLKIMTFNIWYGGEQIDFAKVVEAVRLADPDIVGVQEPDGNLARLAQATGLVYFDTRRNIISRYPLFDSGIGERIAPGHDRYGVVALDRDALHAWAMVRPGKVVAVANTHLTSDPYGPDAVRDGAGIEEVLAMENDNRTPDAMLLAALGRLGADGTPVFLTGDFNSPSHLDWTETARKARPEARFSVEWPATKALAEAGLRDSYREAHPDPAAKPGFTWTPGNPYPFIPAGTVHDRIDFIFTAGRSETVSSQIVGEAGGPDVDIAMSTYPSDHRAVVSTFKTYPVDAPALIAAEPSSVTLGDSFLLRVHLPGAETFSAMLTPRDRGPDAAVTGMVDEQTSYRIAVKLSTAGLSAGTYDALLVAPDGQVARRTRLRIARPGSVPEIAAAVTRLKQGEPVHVKWSNAPGNRHDWIGVFKAGEPSVMNYLSFHYVDARHDGEMDIRLGEAGEPLEPGRYELRLMNDDSYVILARGEFEVGAP